MNAGEALTVRNMVFCGTRCDGEFRARELFDVACKLRILALQAVPVTHFEIGTLKTGRQLIGVSSATMALPAAWERCAYRAVSHRRLRDFCPNDIPAFSPLDETDDLA